MHTTNEVLTAAYSDLYKSGQHDSPNRSRIQMVSTIIHWLQRSGNAKPVILNCGSGPQALERLLWSTVSSSKQLVSQRALRDGHYITLDIADFRVAQRKQWNASHVRGDTVHIPLADDVVDLVVSNHSIDMLRAEPEQFALALAGVNRVLKPGGSAYFNYHEPAIFDTNCAYFAQTRDPLRYPYYNRNRNNPYYSDKTAINTDLRAAGFENIAVTTASHYDEWWWAVSAHKA